MRGRNWLENALQDFRDVIRQLRDTPGFACTAASVLALGIAAVVSIFGLVEAVPGSEDWRVATRIRPRGESDRGRVEA